MSKETLQENTWRVSLIIFYKEVFYKNFLFYLPTKSNIILFGRYFSPPIAVMLVK